MRRSVRRDPFTLRSAESAVAAGDDRAAEREQDRIVAGEAALSLEQDERAQFRPSIEDVDDALVDQ